MNEKVCFRLWAFLCAVLFATSMMGYVWLGTFGVILLFCLAVVIFSIGALTVFPFIPDSGLFSFEDLKNYFSKQNQQQSKKEVQ